MSTQIVNDSEWHVGKDFSPLENIAFKEMKFMGVRLPFNAYGEEHAFQNAMII